LFLCTGSPKTDREALLDLYNETGGPNWRDNRGWKDNDPDLRNWAGVATNLRGRVVGLVLGMNNLRGRWFIIPSR
ncbi:unnamed protein product, partial [Sphacelaria rigidula]